MKGDMGQNEKSEEFDIVLTRGEATVQKTVRKAKKDTVGTGSDLRYLGFIGEVGFAIAIPIAGGVFLGVYLDRRWGTYPRATLSLLFLGVVVSFLNLVRIIQAIIRKE